MLQKVSKMRPQKSLEAVNIKQFQWSKSDNDR